MENDQYMQKKSSNIWMILFIVVVVGLLASSYFIYKKVQEPVEDTIQRYANLNIMTMYKGNSVSTGIIVHESGVEILNTKTFIGSAETVKVYFNNSISISTYNLENQSYFIESIDLVVTSPEPKQVKIRLTKRGEIKVEEIVRRKSISLKIESFAEDFGDMSVFLKARGLVIRSDGMVFYREPEYIPTSLGFDKAYKISENFEKDSFVTVTLPYVRISSTATLTYCVAGVEENSVIGVAKVDGWCGEIKI